MLATGGVSSWRDAVEYMAVGGNAVQVCTEVMLRGYGIIGNMLSGLSGYLEAKGVASVQELHGAALPRIIRHSELSRGKRTACIDADACRACGLCLTLCDESGYSAVVQNESDYVVDAERCDGCGLCVVACPHRAVVLTEQA